MYMHVDTRVYHLSPCTRWSAVTARGMGTASSFHVESDPWQRSTQSYCTSRHPMGVHLVYFSLNMSLVSVRFTLYPTRSSLYIKTEYNYVFRMRYVLLCAYTGRFGMRLVTQTWLGSGCHCRGRISKDVGGAGGAVCVGVLSGSHQQLLKCRRKGDTVLGFAGRLGPACAWEALSFGTSGRVREGQAQTQLRPSCDCPG